MISYLKGTFVNKTPASVQVEDGGIGSEVQITLSTYSSIQNLDSGMLHTHLLVREDAHILFGFFDPKEKEMFQQLISVTGIGASTARVMLSYLKPGELARAIVQSDVKSLEAIKGIGKKSAERIILQLRDKLSRQGLEANTSPMRNDTLHQDALNALAALGINR